MKTKNKIPHLILAGLFGTAIASQGAVLYQSDFTGTSTTLTDYGLNQVASNGGSTNWQTGTDSTGDTLQFNSTANDTRHRAVAYTSNSYGLDPGYKGFSLDVSFLYTGGGIRFSFGLNDVAGLSSNDPVDYNEFAGPMVAFSMAGTQSGAAGGDVLVQDINPPADGRVGVEYLSIAQGNVTDGVETTFSMTVTADSWSYSLDGATPTTGTFATPFDITKDYQFFSSAWSAVAKESYISNITLSQVPEPSSTALLGLGLSSLLLRRRRS